MSGGLYLGVALGNWMLSAGWQERWWGPGQDGSVIGHPTDGDGLSYSLGSTLVQSAGHSWNLLLRYMEINRTGAPSSLHTLSASPQELADVQLTRDRLTGVGRWHFGLGLSRLEDPADGVSSDDVTAFMQWTTE